MNQENSSKVAAAFKAVPRENFVLPIMRDQAYLDQPLPIGDGQTISQPSTVRLMLSWLETKSGDRVLDVGSGSGWTTALLAHLVGEKGKIYAVEKLPELMNFGQANTQRIGIENAEFFEAGKEIGLIEQAPFDRILVSASAQTLPRDLISQVKVGGKVIVPVKNDILEITRTTEGYETNAHRGFVFVPLV